MTKKIIIGSRGSKLALLYAQKAKDTIIQNLNFSDKDIVIKTITTKGDQVKDTRLSEFGGKGLFSSNIEKELQEKNLDIAVLFLCYWRINPFHQIQITLYLLLDHLWW